MKSQFTLLIFAFLFVLIIQDVFFAQGTAGSEADQELRKLIDMQTTGVIESGNIGVSMSVMPKGVLISKIDLGLFKNFSIGISYGASNFIGTGKPDFYNLPGFHSRFKLFTETRILPSLTIGFNSQGKGLFVDSLDRYQIKSPGIFISSLKNFKFLGYISLHSQVNYSLENGDGDDNLNFGIGIEKTIGPMLSIVIEYDLAMNDNFKNSLGDKKGYLNAGLRWSATNSLTLGFDVRNILDNRKPIANNGPERGLFIEYSNRLY